MYEIGDKVIYQGADKDAYKKVGVLKSIEEKDGKPQLTVEFENGETFTAPVDDWSREFTNAVRNGAYDTLIIKKVPQYGNKWCIFSDGSSNRLVPRVFDSPEWAKKYIKEDLPAWADAKIRVQNSCTSTNSVVRNAMAANRRVARNADKLDKRFGNVRVLAYEDGGLGVRYVIDIGGIVEFANAVSWNDAGKKCAEDARHTASLFEKRASLLRQAATWLEQNAK